MSVKSGAVKLIKDVFPFVEYIYMDKLGRVSVGFNHKMFKNSDSHRFEFFVWDKKKKKILSKVKKNSEINAAYKRAASRLISTLDDAIIITTKSSAEKVLSNYIDAMDKMGDVSRKAKVALIFLFYSISFDKNVKIKLYRYISKEFLIKLM